MVKRFFVAAIFLVGLMASAPAQAAPILVPTTDTVLGIFAIDTVAGTQTVTITGAALADIVDGVVVNSGVIDADGPPATDDAVFFDLVDEALLFDFDLASAVGLGTGSFSVLVAGSAITPITDPALTAFLVANNTGFFSLLVEPVITTDEQGALLTALFTYSLDSIAAPTQVEAIPEPATIGLVGMGILAAARARRSRRKNDVA